MRRARLIRRDVGGAPLAGCDPVLDRVYRARGVRDPQDIAYSLKALERPDALLDIERAASRLADAIVRGERIVIVGDYDADGATGVAVAVRALQAFGATDVGYRVPDRFRFGYGLSPELVASLADLRPDVLVTVDNGISSVSGVAAANRLGIDVIVTDHHLPGDELPAALAIVNPNRPGDPFSAKSTAGVGVMFYLMAVLRRELTARSWFKGAPPGLGPVLDLVALGTVADLVPLERNNRILVEQGLRRMRAGGNPGIEALLNVAGRDVARVCSEDLAFGVAPRLNAAGRLDDISVGIECLLTDDAETALSLADRLHEINAERQDLQAQMEAQANRALDDALQRLTGAIPSGLVLFQPDWHQGIVGLLASRIKERLLRPTVVFAPEHDGANVLKGSGRSVRGVHLRDVLAAIDARHPGLIERFGGHAMAAGLTLEQDHLPAFARAFDQAVAAVAEDDAFDAVLHSDGELDPEQIELRLANAIVAGGPWGQAFPEPRFDHEFRVLEKRIVGEDHLKLRLRPAGTQRVFDGIWFRGATADLGDIEHLVYGLGINVYQGVARLQLVVEGWVEDASSES